MIKLKQSTASQEVMIGPLVDATDGFTAETGLTIANTDIKLHKEGASTLSSKNSGGATHVSGGVYVATLDATDTDTLGSLVLICHPTGARPFRAECEVLDEPVFDARGGSPVSADVVADERTWHADEYRARNIIEVKQNFAGTLALAPDMNEGATISSVSAVSITGAATVTASDLTVNRARTMAHFTVPAMSTTGTYTVVVTAVTVDGDTIPTTATMVVR